MFSWKLTEFQIKTMQVHGVSSTKWRRAAGESLTFAQLLSSFDYGKFILLEFCMSVPKTRRESGERPFTIL